jgi:hypothetical protein
MAEKKRKYLLFTKSDGRPDAQKPCAFFISAAGCRNGANCQFSHGDDKVVSVVKEVVKEPKVEKIKKVEKQVEVEQIKEVIYCMYVYIHIYICV